MLYYPLEVGSASLTIRFEGRVPLPLNGALPRDDAGLIMGTLGDPKGKFSS